MNRIYKTGRDFYEKVVDTNGQLKFFCSQWKLDFIDKFNMKEGCIGIPKLHLNKIGISVFAGNIV